MSMETCGDDRFELIEEAKRRLLEATNIEDRPEELAVLDGILFRFWQMGWLDQLREDGGAGTCHVKAVKKLGDSFGFIMSCGHSMVNPFNDCPHYCPWCGAKVVSA